MLRFGINKITYDFIQFTIVYSKEEYIDMLNKCNEVVFEDDDANLSSNRALKVFIGIDAEGIVAESFNNKITLLKNEEPLLDIKKENEEEVVCIISIPYIDNTVKIQLPSLEEIKTSSVELTDEDTNKIIKYLMIVNGFYTTKDVEEVDSYCDVYVKFLGEDIKISSYKPSSYYLDFEQDSALKGKKIGDSIQIENSSSKLFSGEYKITKIIKYEPLELNQEIIKMLDFKNTKNIDEFRDCFFTSYTKILNFNNQINEAYKKIGKINFINVSKYSYNYFVKINENYAKIKTKEQIYDIIKNKYISNYLIALYEKNEMDIKLLDKYFKNEYDVLKLLGTIREMSYQDYLNARIEDAYLYLLLKNKGGK